jgi:hypothetical protein
VLEFALGDVTFLLATHLGVYRSADAAHGMRFARTKEQLKDNLLVFLPFFPEG